MYPWSMDVLPVNSLRTARRTRLAPSVQRAARRCLVAFLIAALVVVPVFLFRAHGSAFRRLPGREPSDDVLSYVDPLIGTSGTGHTFPGPTLPFGRVQPSPDNGYASWEFTSGYHESATSIYGFSQTHLSGTGIHGLMDVTMAPVAVSPGWYDRLVKASSFQTELLRKEHPGEFDTVLFDEMMRRGKVDGGEVATAGYYGVVLGDSSGQQFRVELSVDEGGALHRYSLVDRAEVSVGTRVGGGEVEDGGDGSRDEREFLLVVDIARSHMSAGNVHGGFIRVVSPTVIEGMRVLSAWAKDRALYFRVELSRAFEEVKIVRGSGHGEDGDQAHGGGTSRLWTPGKSGGRCLSEGCSVAFLKYSASNVDGIDGLVARVGISYTGLDGAEAALHGAGAERSGVDFDGGFDFDGARMRAEATWRRALSKIRVEGGANVTRRIFYTGLYHSLIHPTDHTDRRHADGGDTNGSNSTLGRFFLGPDRNVHDLGSLIPMLRRYFSTLSIWDTFRAHYPLMTLISPDDARDIALTTLAHAMVSPTRVLPVWTLGGLETWTMPGYHATSFLAEAINKGLIDDPKLIKLALEHSVISAKYHTKQWFDTGYMPVGGTSADSGSASTTLEHAYDDHCIAEIANAAGNTTEEDRFRLRSVHGYRAIFDTETGFFRGKHENGSFATWSDRRDNGVSFDPDYSEHRGGHYTEGTAHLWRWFVPHDVDGLARLLGGKDRAEEQLTAFFFPREPVSIHGQSASLGDLTGNVGHYAHGNEPAHHAPFLFNLLGAPRKTQFLVRKLLRDMYKDKPDGIIGNDDCGQMSAWYILASIGIYPVNPVASVYQITSPIFTRSTIDLGNGKTFIIDAPGADDADFMYIDRAELFTDSGQLRRRIYDTRQDPNGRLEVTHEEVIAGGKLKLRLVPGPDPFDTNIPE